MIISRLSDRAIEEVIIGIKRSQRLALEDMKAQALDNLKTLRPRIDGIVDAENRLDAFIMELEQEN